MEATQRLDYVLHAQHTSPAQPAYASDQIVLLVVLFRSDGYLGVHATKRE